MIYNNILKRECLNNIKSKIEKILNSNKGICNYEECDEQLIRQFICDYNQKLILKFISNPKGDKKKIIYELKNDYKKELIHELQTNYKGLRKELIREFIDKKIYNEFLLLKKSNRRKK